MRAQWIVLLAVTAAGLTTTSSAHAHPRNPGDRAEITILDREGRVAPSGSRTLAGQTVSVMVGQSGLTFTPSAVSITAGDTVHWVFATTGHTVTSGAPCTVDSSYCSPSNVNCSIAATSPAGATFDHTFSQAGTYSYFCRIHCGSGMRGTVTVAAPFVTILSVTRAANGHFIVTGQTLPNLTIHFESSPDLVTAFGNGVAVTANGTGAFQYDDAGATSLTMRFYRATYP